MKNNNDGWSQFKNWAGKRWWFACAPITEKKEKEDVSSIQRINNLNGKRK